MATPLDGQLTTRTEGTPISDQQGSTALREELTAFDTEPRALRGVRGRPVLLAGILGVAMASAGVAAVAVFGATDPVVPTPNAPGPVVVAGSAESVRDSTQVSDAEMDGLWGECEGGSMTACDALWAASDPGTASWDFGATCGGRYQQQSAGECYFYDRDEYGENADFDALWAECGAGDMESCDTLRYSSPPDSEYYDFAASCGGVDSLPNFNMCVSNNQMEVGDDPEMDSLYNSCLAEDWAACDELVTWTLPESEYFQAGITCGGTETQQTVEQFASCAILHTQNYGDSGWFDAKYDACAAGTMRECDWLWMGTTPESQYYVMGASCGGTRDPADLDTLMAQGWDAAMCDGDGNNDYGEDPQLDELYDECLTGNMLSCKRLGELSFNPGEYQDLAATCGNTTPPNSQFAAGVACWVPAGDTHGSDPTLDALWDECVGSTDLRPCDELAFAANAGSEYELFGATCGGQYSRANWGQCAVNWGERPPTG